MILLNFFRFGVTLVTFFILSGVCFLLAYLQVTYIRFVFDLNILHFCNYSHFASNVKYLKLHCTFLFLSFLLLLIYPLLPVHMHWKLIIYLCLTPLCIGATIFADLTRLVVLVFQMIRIIFAPLYFRLVFCTKTFENFKYFLSFNI